MDFATQRVIELSNKYGYDQASIWEIFWNLLDEFPPEEALELTEGTS